MTFQEQQKYHRSFLWNRPRPMTAAAAAAARFAEESRNTLQSPRQAPTMGTPSGYYGRRRHEAYFFDEWNLESIVMEEKEDQHFAHYATPWELVWSRLS